MTLPKAVGGKKRTYSPPPAEISCGADNSGVAIEVRGN